MARDATPEEHFEQAKAHLAAKRFEEAEQECRAALRIRPTWPLPYVMLADILRRRGNYAGADENVRRAVQLAPDDNRILASANLILGTIYHDQNRFSEARDVFQTAVNLAPDQADFHFMLGGAQHECGNLAAAASSFRRAIELRRDWAEAYFMLGSILVMDGKNVEAEEEFRNAIRIKPDWPLGYGGLGSAQGNREQYTEAERSFRRAIELGEEPGSHAGLGLTLIKQEKFEEALIALQKTLELDPKRYPTYIDIGFCYSHLNRWAEAESAYRKAVRLIPRNELPYIMARNNLADLLRKVGFPEAALAEAAEAHAIRPDFWLLRLTMGEIYVDLGDESGNPECYRQALWYLKELKDELLYRVKSPDKAERLPLCYFLLGYSYAKLGRHSRAIQYFSKCLALRAEDSRRHLGLYLKARDYIRDIRSTRVDLAYIPKAIRTTSVIASVLLAGYAIYQYHRSEVWPLYNRFNAGNLTTLLIASLIGLFVGLYFPYIRKLRIPGLLDLELGKEVSTSTSSDMKPPTIDMSAVRFDI